MPMADMIMHRRSALTDITDMHRTPVRRMGTMARRGLAAVSLLGPAHGIGMPIMAVATMVIADTAIAAVMDTDAATVMAMAVAMDMGMAATDITVATAAGTADTVAASMGAADSMAVAVMAADIGNPVVDLL